MPDLPEVGNQGQLLLLPGLLQEELGMYSVPSYYFGRPCPGSLTLPVNDLRTSNHKHGVVGRPQVDAQDCSGQDSERYSPQHFPSEGRL